ncbi:MAG TPA: pseudouridine synthase [Caulobacteraceae bacterium]|nr:pseudouridine synthase [Caulobacteraceae bacterium]
MPQFERRYDEAEPQRVNRWLAQSGVCSRREAETLIAEGKVRIDGEVVTDAGRKILPGQVLTLEGGEDARTRFTAVINKPVGIVSAQPDPGQIPAVRLITRKTQWGALAPFPALDGGLAPLGRLDMDSRGLLLLSQDGVLAKAVIGPDSRLDKQYRVRVEGEITEPRLELLRHGLELDGRQLKPAQVRRMAGQTLDIVLTEGRNRQIRRMCELVDLRVIDLQRVRIGPLALESLPEGRWRILADHERAALIKASMG